MARTPKATPPVRTAEDEDKDQDQLDLEVVDDADDTAAAVNGNGAVEDSVESLRAQLAEERSNREQAEERARNATATVSDARTRLLDSNAQVIENALAKEDGIKKDLKTRITTAKESGNYADEVDLLDQLQEANLRIRRLAEGKSELERRREEIKDTPDDPVEAYVRGMAPRSADWVRTHSEYVTDESKRADLEAAHYNALGKKLVAGSAQYFAAVERELGLREDDQPPAREERREPTKRPTAAPVSRSNGGGNGITLPDGVEQLSDGKYRLSPTLREYARIAGLSDGDYLKNLLDLHREGKMTH